jgi:hypothetical protein
LNNYLDASNIEGQAKTGLNAIKALAIIVPEIFMFEVWVFLLIKLD